MSNENVAVNTKISEAEIMADSIIRCLVKHRDAASVIAVKEALGKRIKEVLELKELAASRKIEDVDKAWRF